MRLHESPDTCLELIQATADHGQIPAVYVEKDYWVTRVLKQLQESDYGETVVFKGGTALPKAHRLIERFSEDIDLALRRDEKLSGAQRGRLIKRGVAGPTQGGATEPSAGERESRVKSPRIYSIGQSIQVNPGAVAFERQHTHFQYSRTPRSLAKWLTPY